MIKSITLLVLFFLSLGVSQAQKKQNVYFLKNDGKQVNSKDSADFIRVIQEPDSGSTNFTLLEHYVEGKIKTMGFLSSFDPFLVYEGQLLKYGKDGKKESLVDYRQGKPVGKAFFFFSNGKVNKIINYDDIKADSDDWSPYRLEYYVDSTGTIMVDKGNGHYKQHTKSFNEDMIEEGDYLDGMKDGLWTETNTSGTYWFKEKFLKGKFLSGECFKDGRAYIYTQRDEVPSYSGGLAQFYNYLSKSVRYPADARQSRITGKVYLSFVVEKDGSLTDIKVTRGLSPSLNEEAIRVLRQSPNWIPGKQRGIPVRVRFNIPIKFSLN